MIIFLHFQRFVIKEITCYSKDEKIPNTFKKFKNDIFLDFTTMENVDSWYEQSDTVRVPGKSKASLVLQKTQIFQRGIFFVLLNPQLDGSCFAMMKIDGNFDLSGYKGFQLLFKSQSASLQKWKISMETNASKDRFSNYEQQFEVKKKF